jgi:hypothetical protein
LVLQQVTDSDELSELNPALQPVNDTNDLAEINSKGDTPWYQSTSDKIAKVMNFINNPGYAIRNEQPPQVNDLDSSSAFTVIPDLANKVADWSAGKLDKIYPDHPAIGPAVGSAIATLGSLGGGVSLVTPELPNGDINLPLPGTESSAQYFGGHALGITKKMIKGAQGGEEAINKNVQTALDQGIISVSGPKTMLDKAEEVNQNSINNLHSILKSAGQDALDTQKLSGTLIDQLSEPYSQGLYAEDQATVDKIIDTVMAHGQGGIGLDEAQSIKNIFRTKAGSNWNTDAVKASLYQRAYGITSDAMEQGVQKAADSGLIPQESLKAYMDNKAIYGASKMAMTGLRDRVANEAAQNILSVRGSIIAAGALSRGDFAKALEAFGSLEVLSKYGSATGATIMNKLSGFSVPVKSAIIGGLIGTGTASQGMQNVQQPTSAMPSSQNASVNGAISQ